MHTYSETLTPSLARWLMAPGAGVMAGLSTLPLGAAASATASTIAILGMVAFLLYRTPKIRVDEHGLRVGKAYLEAPCIGQVEQLDSDQTRLAMGPQLRLDAYIVHRTWVPSAVKITVADAADPTPYWLISSRKPRLLAQALLAVRQPSQNQAAHSEHTG